MDRAVACASSGGTRGRTVGDLGGGLVLGHDIGLRQWVGQQPTRGQPASRWRAGHHICPHRHCVTSRPPGGAGAIQHSCPAVSRQPHKLQSSLRCCTPRLHGACSPHRAHMPPPKPWLLPLPPNISRPRTLERLSSSRSWSEPYSDMVQNCNKAGSAGSSTFGRLRGSGRSSGRRQPPGQGCPPPAAPGLQACHRPPGWLGRAHGGRAGLAEPLASHHPLPSARLRGCPPVTSPAESDAPMQYARAMKGGRRARPGRMSACGPGSRPLERYSGAAGVCTHDHRGLDSPI